MKAEELNKPVSFPKWAEELASAPDVVPERQDAFRHAIMGYLHSLKGLHARASLASAKAYFDAEREAGRDREAVRWFFRAARRVGRPNIQHGMSNDEGGEGRPNSQHGMSKEDEGEGGTVNTQRSTLKKRAIATG